MEIIALKYVTPENEDLQLLIHHLDQDLLQRYPEEEIFGFDFADEGVNDIAFIAA